MEAVNPTPIFSGASTGRWLSPRITGPAALQAPCNRRSAWASQGLSATRLAPADPGC